MKSVEDLKRDFVKTLINTYGYKESQMQDDYAITENVMVSLVIWRSEEDKTHKRIPYIYVIVDCKDEFVRIDSDEYLKGYEPALMKGATFYVARNLKETRVFYIDNDKKPLTKEVVGDFPKATDIATDAALEAFVKRIRQNNKRKWLEAFDTCHNIIRNAEKLSPEASFDEMSKVLFIKMHYELGRDKEELIYSSTMFEKEEKEYAKKHNDEYYQHCFNIVKEKYKDDKVFESHERLRIRRDTFVSILRTLENLNLDIANDDIKGVAFEKFLGKTFRGELGQFFTPRPIVDYMVKVLDIKEGELVCDPCCGSGGFLIRAFEYVQDKIDSDIKTEIDNIRKRTDIDEKSKIELIDRALSEIDKRKNNSRYFKLCHNYFWGADANARMARTSKMNMIMHGDGHVGVYHHDGLFNVGGIWEGRFDVVLINPPFGSRLDSNNKITSNDIPNDDERDACEQRFGLEYINKVYLPIKEAANKKNNDGTIGMPIKSLFKINRQETEILFIERTLKLLKPGGRAGIVIPEGVMDNDALKKIREEIEKYAEIINITSIPSDVFTASGANIKPGLLFIRKKTEEDLPQDYTLTVTKVNNAGINSMGQPTDTNELNQACDEIRQFIANSRLDSSIYTKVISRSEMTGWSVEQFFNQKVVFNDSFKQVKISTVLKPTEQDRVVDLKDGKFYKRITVRLYNKGVIERDYVKGKDIRTKRQRIVKSGDFIISKIDAKSGAFGIIPDSLDGGIVTNDFLTFTIDTNIVEPLYLELLMNNDVFLEQLRGASSGSTGRKRLRKEAFLNMKIALPGLDTQQEMINGIKDIRAKQAELDSMMNEEILNFNNHVFK